MSDTQLWQRSATDLAALIASSEVSSREVIDAHLQRIDSVNPRLNAITVEMADEARAGADAADAVTGDRGPLHGVPFTIKENIDLVGYPTTSGLAAFAEAMPTMNAVTVERMLGAGAVPIGRTNMPELGLRVSSENRFRGRTSNPWNPTLTAGGSSGGEGSAIGSGMSPIGLGNDIGGSIRNPALCNGIAGLKPGYGRVPRVASLPPQDPGISGQLMSAEGPLARTIADLRLALQILAGSTPRDPRVADVPLVGPPTTKRAGIVRSLDNTTIEPGAAEAVDRAAAALVEAGWQVEDVEVPEIDRVVEIWTHMLGFEFSASIPLLEPIMGSDEIAVLRALVDSCDPTAFPPQAIFMERMRLQRAWSELLGRFPVVVGPGWTAPPFEHGADIVPGLQTEVLESRLRFVVPGNALGFPVLAMTTTVHDGIPAGVQVYADFWRDDLCLDAGVDIEARCGLVTPIDPIWS